MSKRVDGLPDLAQVRRWQGLLLERLAKGPDPVFAEIAEEVRSGRMTLREAALSPAYQETFAAAAATAMRAVAARSPAEVAEAAAANPIEARIAELEATPPPDAPARAEQPVDEEPADSFMVGPPSADREDRPQRRERWNRRW